MTIGSQRNLQVRVGFVSETGKRATNEDYVAACLGQTGAFNRDIVAAVADGVGGHKGGREAAELTVRCFLDAYYSLPETLGVRRIASRALEAANSWIHAQGRVDSRLSGMSCAFSSMILSRRTCHIVHIGDTRAYRLSEGRLERLTKDHVAGRGDLAHVLNRAIGFEDFARVDYTAVGLRQHDRLLICSDGVHGVLDDGRLQVLLDERASPEETARKLVDTALAAGSSDNMTALVLDVIDLPPADRNELTHAIETLPILELPSSGETIDDFVLQEVLSDGRYSRLFVATDKRQNRKLVLKFPHPARRQRRFISSRLRTRSMGGGPRQKPVDRRDHRGSRRTPDAALFGDAAVRGRNAGAAAEPLAAALADRRHRDRDQAGTRGGDLASRRHHPSRHQA